MHVGTSKPEFASVDISIISIFLGTFEHWTSCYAAIVARDSDVQPALMLSFYTVSISQDREQGFVVKLLFGI